MAGIALRIAVWIIKNRIMRSIYKKYIVVALLAALMAGSFFYYKSNNADEDIDNYDTVKQFKYSFNLKNITPRKIRDANVWLSVPVLVGANQKTLSLQSSESHKLFFDGDNNQEMYFSYPEIEKGEVKSVMVDMKVAFSGNSNEIIELMSDKYLADERNLDLNNSAIQEKAKSLKDIDSITTTANILAWLKIHNGLASEELAKSTAGPDKNMEMDAPGMNSVVYQEEYNVGALDVLNKKHVSKSGLLYLYLAISRTSGIPSRGVVGFYFSGTDTLSASDATVWAEYFDGKVWRLVDLDEFRQIEDGSGFIKIKVLDILPENAGWKPFSVLHRGAAYKVDAESIKLIVN